LKTRSGIGRPPFTNRVRKIDLRLIEVLKRKKSKGGIAEIIATLLMILIAIASAAILYTYVIGLIGSDATTPTATPLAMLTTDSSCVSVSNKCDGIYGYFVAIRNIGPSSINGGTAQIYFSNLSTGSTGFATCTIPSGITPGMVFSCGSANIISISQGQQVSIKVVDPDGGSASVTIKATL
jgi:hypothetical protein